MTKLHLTNTLTKKKEEFVSLQKGRVLLYGCGVTPYSHSHIGHGRSYVFIDTLVRFLRYAGYDVTYVRNVTDIDDKLLKKAQEAGDLMGYKAIAKNFTDLYRDEMAALNCLVPNDEPTVTGNIDPIIEFIKGLVDTGKAYVVEGDVTDTSVTGTSVTGTSVTGTSVYFDVTAYEPYGQLSGKNLDDLFAGARVKVDKRKKNPADFALWKGNDEELFWKSPWGYGRPGWHIECSALAKKYLGETIDIHCGGMDLIFPHHENERAQSESLHGVQFVNYWIHNALLNIDKQKMSKSLGNILGLKTIFEKYDPMVLRFYFLQHHYKTPIEFSFEMLDAAQVAYKKLIKVFEHSKSEHSKSEHPRGDHPVVQAMTDALADDLNTPKMLGILFEHLSQIKDDKVLCDATGTFLRTILGLTFVSIDKAVELTPEIEELIEQRKTARQEKRWADADTIRDRLKSLGYEIQDKKT